MTPVDNMLAALRDNGLTPTRAGDGWSCRCPAHDDRNPSLSISTGDDGRALARCHAGCDLADVLGAVGLTMADLFAESNERHNGHASIGTRRKPSGSPPKPAPASHQTPDNATSKATTFATANEALHDLDRRNGQRVGLWTYHDASGQPVGVVARYDKPSDHGGKPSKRVLPVSKHDGCWANRHMPTPRPPYRLPELLDAPKGSRVYVVEGEKACDAAVALGLVATTSAGGSNAAGQTDWSALAGHDVVILPDHDAPGEKYAEQVAALALAAGAASVRVVRLAEQWPDLPDGGDVADLIGTEDHDAIRASIEAMADEAPSDAPAPRLEPIRVGDLIARYPTMRPPVVDGLFRQGEVCNYVAGPKVGKSWMVHALAGAVASGRPWLDFRTVQGRVLILDAELHPETLANRLGRMLRAQGLDAADLDRNGLLEVLPVRGRQWCIDHAADLLARKPLGHYSLVVVDALYRFLRPEWEENRNEHMTACYNLLDAMAEQSGAAIVVVHHASKGNQSDKRLTDVGSGAGAISRAADSHLILRPHEEEGAVVVEAVTRSSLSPDPFVVRWFKADCRWELAPDLDPAQFAKPPSRRTQRGEKADPKPVERWDAERFAREVVGDSGLIKPAIIERAKDKGLSKAQAENWLKIAEGDGLVHRDKGAGNTSHTFSTTAPTMLDSLDGQGGGEGASSPQPPVLSAPGGCGGDARPPSPPSTPPDNPQEWGEIGEAA